MYTTVGKRYVVGRYKRMKVKRFIAVICLLTLLMSMCFGCSAVAREQRAVVNDYKSWLRQAVRSDDLTGLKVGSYQPDIVTDPEQIEQWLAMLNKIKVECVSKRTIYGAPTYVTFLYPEEEVELGGFIATGLSDGWIYTSSDEQYMLHIVNWEDVDEEFTTLKSIAWKTAAQSEAQ